MFRICSVLQPSRLCPGAILTGYLLLLVSLAVSETQVPSAITPDGTLGTIVTPHGRVFGITGGTRPNQGPNLFHSFGQFDVGTGDTAHFVGQPGIENIIGRVTGGRESLIDGRLQSDASLFLLNPSGLMFGPNATLDVNGSFHASTADALRFADGATFSARLNEKSTLTVAAPSAFGFINEDPAGISIQGSRLQVAEGEMLSIIGGDLEIVGNRNDFLNDPANLAAPGGQINLASIGSTGEVVLEAAGDTPALNVSSSDTLGAIEIKQNALVDTSHDEGGTVVVRGDSLTMDQASIMANTLGNVNGTEVGIDITAASVYVDHSLIGAITFGEGHAGNIMLDVGTLDLIAGGVIDSTAIGAGQGGDVIVTARQGVTITGASTFGNPSDAAGIFAGTGGAGNAGRVIISAPALNLQGFASISTSTFAEGNAGSIEIEVNSISLSEGAGIFSNTSGTGPGGTVTITAGESLSIRDGGVISISAFDSGNAGQMTILTPNLFMDGGNIQATGGEDSTGAAGTVRIEAGHISLTGSAQLDSSTDGAGRGGDITVISDDIHISDTGRTRNPSGFYSEATSHGHAGRLTISTSTLTMDGGVIRTRTLGEGNAGTIDVHTDRITLTNGAQFDSSTLSNGQGGAIAVMATDRMIIRGANNNGSASGLYSVSGGSGAAGQICVAAASLELKEDAIILTSAAREGRAGVIDVNAKTIALTNGAQIKSHALDNGPGGTVVITAGHIQMAQNSTIDVRGAGDRAGGTVVITAGNIELAQGSTIDVRGAGAGTVRIQGEQLVIDNATIDALTFGDIDGGDIDVRLTGDLTIRDGAISAASSGNGRAGDIVIDVGKVTLTNGGLISSVTEPTGGSGQAGNVTVSARDSITIAGRGRDFNPGGASGLLASTGGDGNAGRVSVSTPMLTIDDGIIQSVTLADGDAGDIQVEVGRLTLTGGAQILNSSGSTDQRTGHPRFGSGQAGNLKVIATEAIFISGRDFKSFPSSFSTVTQGSGNAGHIAISTPILTMDGGRIESATLGDGHAGNLTIEVGQLRLTGGAQIASASGSNAGNVGRGQGGKMTITAADEIFISGPSSGIFSNTFGSGAAGHIAITASTLRMDNEGAIEAEGAGGRAGDIDIGAGNIFLTNSTVTAKASQADGGNIALTAPSLLRLRDSTIAATVSGGPETVGGNITIDLEFGILENSQILSNANQGRGGDIDIEAGVFLANPTSLVSAIALNSEIGIDGEVNVEAVATNLSDVVTPLQPDFASASSLLRDRCAAQLQEGTVSSLVARGRASVPATPAGILPSRLYQPIQASAAPPETERRLGKSDALLQGWPQIINGPFPAYAPLVLKCNWTKP